MARKATRDTYATIIGGGGVEQQVRVFAGHIVPNSYQMEEGSYEEVEGGLTSIGAAAEPAPDKPAPESEDAGTPPTVQRTTRSTRKSKDSGAGS
jgi:hypothetical protein